MRKYLFVIALLVCCNISGLANSTLAASSPNAQPVRAVHFVLRGVAVEDAKHMADLAKASGFNTLIISLADAVKFGTFPGKPLKNALSPAEFMSVVQHARLQGLAVIPEVKLLTHQEKFFGDSRPNLMFNTVTYDPRKSEIYDLIFPYLNEIIKLMQPSAIHIGHDEVVGWNKKHFEKVTRPGELILPADLFLEDVNRLHAFLKKKGVNTWMWGDMLIAPDEFPQMLSKHLHGGIPGYGRELRRKLPKDIVIADWHYFDDQVAFPSLATFKSDGFQVLGSTWKKFDTTKNFSRYASKNSANGMIATTWVHVQRKEWDVVERIIRESGETFRKDFPDVR